MIIHMGAMKIKGWIGVFRAHSIKGNGHNGLLQVHRMQTGLGKPKNSKKLDGLSIYFVRKISATKDWYRVRFSDEVQFGYGPQNKLNIIWKPLLPRLYSRTKRAQPLLNSD